MGDENRDDHTLNELYKSSERSRRFQLAIAVVALAATALFFTSDNLGIDDAPVLGGTLQEAAANGAMLFGAGYGLLAIVRYLQLNKLNGPKWRASSALSAVNPFNLG